jgi:type IV secretion system protein VirD4
VLVAVCGLAAHLPRPRPLHGESSFAKGHEIADKGLFGDDGLLLGLWRARYLIFPGQQGVAVAASPRSGKGVGVVVPNCLHWRGSLVCCDIKIENWTITAGFRAACGQACFLFEPLNEHGVTARWNPFTYVSANHAQRINDLQRVASMLYPDVPGTDPFWIASARSLFLGIALYLFETPHLPKTIGEVLRQGMASDDEGFGHHWRRIVEGRRSGRYPLSGECVRALYDVIDLAPVTASSVRKTFTSRLDLWLNPILDRATAESDFDLRELRRTPMSIYVGVKPEDLHRLRPVLALFFEQALGLQTRTLPEHDPSLKYQVLMLLDEVAALGRLPILAESISYLPGFNVRVALIFQALSQLREVYGIENTKTMLKSLGARLVFAPKDFEDAKEISDELGSTTVRVRSHSRPRFGLWTRGRREESVTISDQMRPLLLPQEVKTLGTEREIIFLEGLNPILARKIRYYADRRFRRRLLPPPAHPVPINGRRIETSSTAEPFDLEIEAPANEHEQALAEDKEPHETRAATLADIDRLESLTIKDYAADFSKVQLPTHSGPWSERELKTAVDTFLDSLRSA